MATNITIGKQPAGTSLSILVPMFSKSLFTFNGLATKAGGLEGTFDYSDGDPTTGTLRAYERVRVEGSSVRLTIGANFTLLLTDTVTGVVTQVPDQTCEVVWKVSPYATPANLRDSMLGVVGLSHNTVTAGALDLATFGRLIQKQPNRL